MRKLRKLQGQENAVGISFGCLLIVAALVWTIFAIFAMAHSQDTSTNTRISVAVMKLGVTGLLFIAGYAILLLFGSQKKEVDEHKEQEDTDAQKQ